MQEVEQHLWRQERVTISGRGPALGLAYRGERGHLDLEIKMLFQCSEVECSHGYRFLFEQNRESLPAQLLVACYWICKSKMLHSVAFIYLR